MTITFPKLTGYQREVYDWLGDPYKTGKIAVLKSVRQSGKTWFCMTELIQMALRHCSTSAIYEPTLALARNVFKSVQKALEPTGMIKIANGQLLEIELTNGSTILFKSTEQNSRGLTCTGLLILDECAYLVEENIFTILPLVNAVNAPIIIASTPFTQSGYYFEMFKIGLSGSDCNIRSFDWSKNPEISKFLTDDKKSLYRETMSRQKYRTEVEGEFLVDDGLLFAGIEKCLGKADESSRVLFMGIDFGTGSEKDWTVLSVLNDRGEMVNLHRTHNLTPMQQVEWLNGLIDDYSKTYTIRTILAEENSIGKVYIDAMSKQLPKGISITNWTTNNRSKQDLVTAFQIALEKQYVTILDNPVLLNELKRYQSEVNEKTRTVTYNGYGANDDTVIATMLAYWAYKKNLGVRTFSLV